MFSPKILPAEMIVWWSNGAGGVAAEPVVIVGFSTVTVANPQLYEYQNNQNIPIRRSAREINGYLIDGEMVFIHSRLGPPSSAPEISGSRHTDGGNLLLDPCGGTTSVIGMSRSRSVHQAMRSFVGVLEQQGAVLLVDGWHIAYRSAIYAARNEAGRIR